MASAVSEALYTVVYKLPCVYVIHFGADRQLVSRIPLGVDHGDFHLLQRKQKIGQDSDHRIRAIIIDIGKPHFSVDLNMIDGSAVRLQVREFHIVALKIR